MKYNKPDFLIVGAAKAGTTSLYYYLKQHHKIWFPKIKETKYFSSKIKKYPQNGIGDWSIDKAAITSKEKYYNLYKDAPNGVLKGEASPDYLLFSSEVAKLIKNELGDIPIIISLRNPIYRAFSAYGNMIRDNREFLKFRDALNHEEERIKKNWDFMWYYKRSGMYSSQILDFKKVFSKVKIVFFENLIENPQLTIDEIYKFLNVSTGIKVNTIQYNPSGTPKKWYVKLILNRRSRISVFLRELIKLIFPRKIIESFIKTKLSKTRINKSDFFYLQNYYDGEISKIEKILNKDLSEWRKWKK